MASSVVERFIRYAKIETTSNPASDRFPSTTCQLDLARLLVSELEKLGLSDVSLDENGYVMATLPANTELDAPVIGFIAHMDTSPDMTAVDVKPQIVEYQGGDIVLNAEKGIVLSPREFPDLAKYTGQTLITTDGNTLLGADDKAGVAEIMAALEHLIQNPDIKHGKIRICFTPDEEVGRGADRFDVAKFGADFAYTMDGGEIGELQYENFNAAAARVTIHGRSIHPGSAKDKMINACQLAVDFHNTFPTGQRPESTEGYEGFYHLTAFQGNIEEARLMYIIREHDRQKFEIMKDFMQQAAERLNNRYGAGTVVLEMRDQYYNMKEKIEPLNHIIDLARQAMLDLGITPLVIPIRGGTDGSRLSYMGLPCPNIFNGGHNYHGRYEFVPIFAMEKAVDVIVRICELAVKH